MGRWLVPSIVPTGTGSTAWLPTASTGSAEFWFAYFPWMWSRLLFFLNFGKLQGGKRCPLCRLFECVCGRDSCKFLCLPAREDHNREDHVMHITMKGLCGNKHHMEKPSVLTDHTVVFYVRLPEVFHVVLLWKKVASLLSTVHTGHVLCLRKIWFSWRLHLCSLGKKIWWHFIIYRC